MRLTDFEIAANASRHRASNEALFALSEGARLWIRDARVEAPFRKIAVRLAAPREGLRTGVFAVDEVCEVTLLASDDEIVQGATELAFGVARVGEALDAIQTDVGWTSPPLRSFLSALSEWPLVHHFPTMSRSDAANRVHWTPYLACRPGETIVGVALERSGETRRDVVVVRNAGPLYLEEDFPLAGVVVRDAKLQLVSRRDGAMATVDQDGRVVIEPGLLAARARWWSGG